MLDGKRSLAERIIYDAFALIEAKQKRPPLDVFEQALKNATPTIEVKPPVLVVRPIRFRSMFVGIEGMPWLCAG